MIRALAILTLLLWLTLPASLVGWIWTGDWRWPVTGVIASLAGSAIGAVLREYAKRRAARKVALRPARRTA